MDVTYIHKEHQKHPWLFGVQIFLLILIVLGILLIATRSAWVPHLVAYLLSHDEIYVARMNADIPAFTSHTPEAVTRDGGTTTMQSNNMIRMEQPIPTFDTRLVPYSYDFDAADTVVIESIDHTVEERKTERRIITDPVVINEMIAILKKLPRTGGPMIDMAPSIVTTAIAVKGTEPFARIKLYGELFQGEDTSFPGDSTTSVEHDRLIQIILGS